MVFAAAMLTAFLMSDAKGSVRPNVLFIAIDDLNDWIGPLGGHPLVKTPAMDRLGARGTVFTQAQCQAPLCNPSRTSLLTGLRPTTTGVYSLDCWFRDNRELRDYRTLPQHFMDAGYEVVTCGKIFHDAFPPKERRANGVEFSQWGPHGKLGPKPATKLVETPDPMWLIDWGIHPEKDEDCFDYDIAEWACERMSQFPREKPFLLCVGFRHPHVPCFAPAKWFALYPDDDRLLPKIQPNDREDTPRSSWFLHWKLPEPRLRWLVTSNQWQPLVRSYLASVSFTDAMVGKMLDALKQTGHEDDTVVVLWSDHGWHLGEKEMTGKTTLWQRSTRVPLMIAGPGINRGRCEAPVELLDIFPTLIDVCQLPARSELEGQSLLPQLRDSLVPRSAPAVCSHGPGNHLVRRNSWSYIRYADGAEELYDLAQDPHEWTNLADRVEHAGVKADLSKEVPTESQPPIPGSRVRLIEYKEGVPYWEGKAILPDEPILR